MFYINIKSGRHEEMIDISSQLQRLVADSGPASGLAFVYCPHTTAALTINEGADPDVQTDMLAHLNELAPWAGPWRHAEGNSAAHIKASLLSSSQSLIIEEGRLKLGRWQRLFFCEFDGPRSRTVLVKFLEG